MLYEVHSLSDLVTDSSDILAVFESFFDACDYVDEHSEDRLYIEMVDEPTE